jgi:hypothetical protein
VPWRNVKPGHDPSVHPRLPIVWGGRQAKVGEGGLAVRVVGYVWPRGRVETVLQVRHPPRLLALRAEKGIVVCIGVVVVVAAVVVVSGGGGGVVELAWLLQFGGMVCLMWAC